MGLVLCLPLIIARFVSATFWFCIEPVATVKYWLREKPPHVWNGTKSIILQHGNNASVEDWYYLTEMRACDIFMTTSDEEQKHIEGLKRREEWKRLNKSTIC